MFALVMAVVLTAVTAPAFAIQAVRVMRRRTVDGLSVWFCLMLSWSSGIWVAHGAIHHNVAQVVAESACLLAIVVLLLGFVRFAGVSVIKLLALSAGFVAFASLAYAVAGPTGIALIALTMPILCRVPQIAESIHNPGGVAISTSGFAICATADFLWILNGISVGDITTVATAVYSCAFGVFIVVRARTRTTIEQIASTA